MASLEAWSVHREEVGRVAMWSSKANIALQIIWFYCSSGPFVWEADPTRHSESNGKEKEIRGEIPSGYQE